MKKIKVLLANITSHTLNLNRFREVCENVPLACGCLKAYALASGLDREVVIDILPQSLADLGGDQGIISYISEKHYDIVGFSLYQWNALRSLHLARQVKKKNPAVRIIAGGPEVSPLSEYLLNDAILDCMIEGEGEEPFVRLLRSLREKGRPDGHIPGLMYREGDHLVYDSPPEAIQELSSIPSPYLNGFIEQGAHQFMHLETLRGCIFNCRYCSWKRCGRQRLSFFPIERLRQEILLAREKGVRKLRFLDSSINLSRSHLRELCEMIAAENGDRFLEIMGFIHPEFIDEESAKWLSEINVKYFILGLQSTNPDALRAIGREASLDLYLRGTSLLRRYGINFVSCIILGLPGDTVSGFTRTLDFLQENNQTRVICFPLSVSPNTPLRHEAEARGIRYQKMPPNLVMSTPTMTFSDLRECVKLFRQRFSLICNDAIFEKDLHFAGRKYFPSHHHTSSDSYPSLTTYAQGSYPWKPGKKPAGKPLRSVLSKKPLSPITRILLSPECRKRTPEETEEMALLLAPMVSWNTLLWLRSFCAEDLPFLKCFLPMVSRENPLHVWHLVLEFRCETSLDLLREISASIRRSPTLLDYESLYEQENPAGEYADIGSLFYGIVPHDAAEFTEEWLSSLSHTMPLFWSITIPSFLKETPHSGDGFLIDFSPENLPSQILYTLNVLKNYGDARPRLFKNWVIQRLWYLHCLGQVSTRGLAEHMLEITPEGNAVLHSFTEETLQKQLFHWIKSRSPRY